MLACLPVSVCLCSWNQGQNQCKLTSHTIRPWRGIEDVLNTHVSDHDLSSLCGLIDCILTDLESKDFCVKDKEAK